MTSFYSLFERRKALCLTQTQLGAILGVDKDRISAIERGMQPPEHRVRSLAAAYQVSIDQFWKLFRGELVALGGAEHGNTNAGAVAADGGGLPHAVGVADAGSRGVAGRRGSAGSRETSADIGSGVGEGHPAQTVLGESDRGIRVERSAGCCIAFLSDAHDGAQRLAATPGAEEANHSD